MTLPPNTVALDELVAEVGPPPADRPLTVALGRRPDGSPVLLDLGGGTNVTPHLLIYGAAGLESNPLLDAVLRQLAANNDATTLQWAFVDPQHSPRWRPYNDLALRWVPGSTAPGAIDNLFLDVMAEMNRRYARFAAGGVASLTGWNKNNLESKLPALVIVVENADPFLGDPTDEEMPSTGRALAEIAMKGRGAGIFLVIATSRTTPEALPENLVGLLNQRVAVHPGDDDGVFGLALLTNGEEPFAFDVATH